MDAVDDELVAGLAGRKIPHRIAGGAARGGKAQ